MILIYIDSQVKYINKQWDLNIWQNYFTIIVGMRMLSALTELH